ncbi:hypoxanthine phosphoribosyltransferase [Paucidesulfovibrio gracilis DSM 16080]|jgi:hypoxanthine phosphoribosyltransferase|uniref:Hypoxanthine phosphoribosyltransferase n=1 Tax=Paucidesulfovibrio gracilis DSM 16080 TaxID=1121449 RepID=A0A1T4XPD5_9BACT|nr:hypoxanthine phosphoribosyltransferase [Paucidesulfovibrio gracilis]SKA91416.1 hypoxanthine phosphoribosyltransferase [Paucidesulfovibrio gracilis DSM 16080]
MSHTLSVLVDADTIHQRVRELGREMGEAYGNEPVVLVCVLKGAFLFFADLARAMTIECEHDFVRLASYGSGTSRGKEMRFSKDLEVPIEGKHVVIVEDIVDTGNSVEFLKHVFAKRRPQSLKVCALVDKRERRELDINVDFAGFNLTGAGFLVGYGMDYAERYRELDAIYELVRHQGD